MSRIYTVLNRYTAVDKWKINTNIMSETFLDFHRLDAWLNNMAYFHRKTECFVSVYMAYNVRFYE